MMSFLSFLTNIFELSFETTQNFAKFFFLVMILFDLFFGKKHNIS